MTDFDLVLVLIVLSVLSAVVVYLLVLREAPAPRRSNRDPRGENAKEGTR